MQKSFWLWQCSVKRSPSSPHHLEFGPHQYLFGDKSALNKSNQTILTSGPSSSIKSHGSFSRVADERELQPGGSGLKLLEQVGEGQPYDQAVLGGNIYMHYKVLGGNGPKQQVKIASSKSQRLWPCARNLDVVACRDVAGDFEHCRLHCLVHERGHLPLFCCLFPLWHIEVLEHVHIWLLPHWERLYKFQFNITHCISCTNGDIIIYIDHFLQLESKLCNKSLLKECEYTELKSRAMNTFTTQLQQRVL